MCLKASHFWLIIFSSAVLLALGYLRRPPRDLFWTNEEQQGHIRSFALSKVDADELFRRYSERSPFPIYGQSYVYDRYFVYPEGPPMKAERKLSGIYIHGDTAQVELRLSQRTITVGDRTVPRAPWITVKVLGSRDERQR